MTRVFVIAGTVLGSVMRLTEGRLECSVVVTVFVFVTVVVIVSTTMGVVGRIET